MFKFKRSIFVLVMMVFSVLLFTSQSVPDNANGFSADRGSFQILDSYQGRKNVIKVDGTKSSWAILMYSLAQYKEKAITIELTAEVWREKTTGNIIWQINNPSYPIVSVIENAKPKAWHKVSGRLIITPTDNNPILYFTRWGTNNDIDTFYISNPTVKIMEGDSLTPDLSLTPLKSTYANNFLIGTTTYPNGLNLTGKYFDVLKHHFNVVTINSTYPSQLAPSSKGGAYQWSTADNSVDIVVKNNIPAHGHILVWHESTPAWITEGSRDEVIKNMKDHITTVLKHFSGKINAWDVVNEAIKQDITATEAKGDWKKCVRTSVPGTPNPWYEKLGSDYIELAFRTARAADPNVKLYYNDYNLEAPNKAEVLRKVILDINSRYKKETGGTRNLIEGVGSQSHIYTFNPNIDNIRKSLDILTSLGIEVAITELDVSPDGYKRGEKKDTVMSEKDAINQGIAYARLMSLFKEFPSIVRVTFWDLDDYNSWLSESNPTLFDRNLNAKQAFYAVSDPDGFLRQHGGSATPVKIPTSGGETVKGSFNAYAGNSYMSLSSSVKYQIVDLPGENRTGVLKVTKPGEWAVAVYDLKNYKGKKITITFSAEVKRVGANGTLNWQINNNDYPSVGNPINNAEAGIWHSMSGTWTGIPSGNNPSFYLNTYNNNSTSTTYYIDNFTITVN
jgi:GH35 family endo-1,4-beta-xylanase